MKKNICAFSLLLLSLIFSSVSFAQNRGEYRDHPTFTYDVGAASGTYNDHGYTEVNVGLNWYFIDWLSWRNSLFTRFGSNVDSVTGLDTSLHYSFNTDKRAPFGIGFFAGAGYRIAKTEAAGPFAEGGLLLRAGGISVGAGVKEILYPSPGTNSDGSKMPDHDTTIMLILAGGGAF